MLFRPLLLLFCSNWPSHRLPGRFSKSYWNPCFVFSIRKFIVVLLSVAVCNSSFDCFIFSLSFFFVLCSCKRMRAFNGLGVVNLTFSPFVTDSSYLFRLFARSCIWCVLLLSSCIRSFCTSFDKSICSFHARQIRKTDGSGWRWCHKKAIIVSILRECARHTLPFLPLISIFHAICHSFMSIRSLAVCIYVCCAIDDFIWCQMRACARTRSSHSPTVHQIIDVLFASNNCTDAVIATQFISSLVMQRQWCTVMCSEMRASGIMSAHSICLCICACVWVWFFLHCNVS